MDAAGTLHQFSKSKCFQKVLKATGAHRNQKDKWIIKKRGHSPKGKVCGRMLGAGVTFLSAPMQWVLCRFPGMLMAWIWVFFVIPEQLP